MRWGRRSPCAGSASVPAFSGDRPIRLFHGAADDYVPVAPCRSYVERLRRRGKDVALTEYAGAYHLFDNPAYPLVRQPNAQAARRCTLEEKEAGNVINVASGRTFTWDDPCVERGAMVGYDERAHADAVRDISALVKRVFKLP